MASGVVVCGEIPRNSVTFLVCSSVCVYLARLSLKFPKSLNVYAVCSVTLLNQSYLGFLTLDFKAENESRNYGLVVWW